MNQFGQEILIRLNAIRDSLSSRWYSIDPKVQTRVKIAVILIESVGISLFLRRILLNRVKSSKDAPILVSTSLSVLMGMLRDQRISRLSYFPDGRLVGECTTGKELIESYRVPGGDSTLFELVEKNCGDFRYITPKPNVLAVLTQVVVPLAFLGVWYKLLQQFMKSASGTDAETSFDRKQRIPKVSFEHVISNSKIELEEIVGYLNDPKKFSQHGAKLPRGVLLVGASGTGKTLMARAVAGEAKCAFLSVSASEFVETYVGRGSARVRQLFKQARELAPCVLFVDEIDALGKRQASFAGGTAHDEYVQTMNQLLVELDGIGGHQDGIVVIAATNRFYALDTALLRPGRFDRHVWLHLPTENERFQILELNTKLRNLQLDKSVDLHAVAKNSLSFSGADLANVVNESVFFSLRRKAKAVGMEDFKNALEKCHHVVFNRNQSVTQTTTFSNQFHQQDINTALE